MVKVNNLEAINMNDFEKLEDTVAPSFCAPVMKTVTNYNYNIKVTNNVSNSCGTTVNNCFSF